MKQSPFRAWLQNLWMENKDEHAEARDVQHPRLWLADLAPGEPRHLELVGEQLVGRVVHW